MNARKVAIPEAEVLELLEQVDRVYASSGRSVVVFDLKKETLSREDLLKVVCRNGKLRAPALRTGRTLIVGFDESTYSRLFS